MTFWEKVCLNRSIKQKLAEFRQAGYDTIQLPEFIEYCENYLWPRGKATTIKAKKAALAKVTVYQYFDYQQLRIQTTQKAFSDLDDFSDLF